MNKKSVIKPAIGWSPIDLAEILRFRDLFITLAYRDYRVRYAQTFLGFLWAFIQPLATLLVFILVFGKAANVDTSGIPYPLFAVCGMTSWTFFAYVLSQSGTSIVNSQELIKKIYFPRVIIPLSKAVVGLVDFAIMLVFVSALLSYYGFALSSSILYLPFFVFFGILASLSIGIWLSALTIRFRDFQHVVPFMVQFGLYVSPIAYPSTLITESIPKWASILYFLNPMAGIVEGTRWSILDTEPPGILSMISFLITVLLFVSGLFYFRRVEKVMADLI